MTVRTNLKEIEDGLRSDDYKKMRQFLRKVGVKKDDAPVSLVDVFNVLGEDRAMTLIKDMKFIDPVKARAFAVDLATAAVPVWKRYHTDRRVVSAVEAARGFVEGRNNSDLMMRFQAHAADCCREMEGHFSMTPDFFAALAAATCSQIKINPNELIFNTWISARTAVVDSHGLLVANQTLEEIFAAGEKFRRAIEKNTMYSDDERDAAEITLKMMENKCFDILASYQGDDETAAEQFGRIVRNHLERLDEE